MPTVSTTFSWTLSADGWTDRGLTANIAAAFEAGDGDPLGCFKFTCTVKNMASTREGWLSGTRTWEAMGVPAGATVTHVRVTGWRRKLVANAKLNAHHVNPIIYADDSTTVLADLGTLALPTATELVWGAGAASSLVAVAESHKASSAQFRIGWGYVLSTLSGGGSASIDMRFDEVSLEITYATVKSGTASSNLPSLSQAASGEVTHEATVVQALPAITQSSVGEVVHEATAASALSLLSQAAVGEVIHEGSSTQQIPALMQVLSGEVSHKATATSALPAFTQYAEGTHFLAKVGEISQNLPALTQGASGYPSEREDAVIANVLLSLEQSLSGKLSRIGSASSTLSLSQAAIGSIAHEANAANILPSLAQLAVGTEIHSGAITTGLGALSQSATGEVAHEGTITSLLLAIGTNAQGEVTHEGTANSVLPGLRQTATNPGTVSELPPLSQAATGNSIRKASADNVVPAITSVALGEVVGTGSAASTMPSLSQAATGSTVKLGSIINLLPSLTQFAINPPLVAVGRAKARLSGPRARSRVAAVVGGKVQGGTTKAGLSSPKAKPEIGG